jgi:hypothetical protein
MSWDFVTAAAAWAGAIGVIATLFYLARQIGLAAKQVEAQIIADVTARAFEAYDPIYEGRNAEIMFKGLNSANDLSEVEAFVFDLLMHRQLGVVIQVVTRHKSDDLPRDHAEAMAIHY